LVSNKFTEVNPIKVTSESLNCTALHKAFRERVSYVDIARNKRVQTSIDATMGFDNSDEKKNTQISDSSA